MFSAGPGGGWSQEDSIGRIAIGRAASGRTASDVVRPAPTKNSLRKKNERENTTALLATLELLAPNVDANKGQPGHRSKALRGRAKEELLKDVVQAVRLARRLMAPGALEQAYTTQSGAGLLAIDLNSGAIAHQSLSFQVLTSWIPEEARGNIRVCLESRDGDEFHSFCQSAVRDAGEPYGETFLGRDKVVGRSITVRFFTRAPGPPGLQNPEWLLMIRAVKLTLVRVQPRLLEGGTPAAGTTLPFFGQRPIPEAVGVFTADLGGVGPAQWGLQVAHVRYLLDMEVASGSHDMDVGKMQPLEQIATFFNCDFSKQEGSGGASVFSRAAAQLGTSALNIAHRSVSWLTHKALRITYQWSMRLEDDDSVSISALALFTLLGGLNTSVAMDFVGGKVGFSHGGLDALYFVADPAQPLDGVLRATLVRIASTKTPGEFDVHRPFVLSCAWGRGNFELFCKSLALDTVGKKD